MGSCETNPPIVDLIKNPSPPHPSKKCLCVYVNLRLHFRWCHFLRENRTWKRYLYNNYAALCIIKTKTKKLQKISQKTFAKRFCYRFFWDPQLLHSWNQILCICLIKTAACISTEGFITFNKLIIKTWISQEFITWSKLKKKTNNSLMSLTKT